MPYMAKDGRHSKRAYGESPEGFAERKRRRARYHKKLAARRRRNRDGKSLRWGVYHN